MPTYMDMHDIPGVKADAVAGAHEADLKIQRVGATFMPSWGGAADPTPVDRRGAVEREDTARDVPASIRASGRAFHAR